MTRYPGSRRVIRFEPEPDLDLTIPEQPRKQMDEFVIARARTLRGQRQPTSELVQDLLGPVHAGNIDVHELLRRLDILISGGRVLTEDEIRYRTYGRV